MPAFGLAAWMANLPVRHTRTPKQQRHAQVLAWLIEDITVSAQLWQHVAAFMKAKGAYLVQSTLGDLTQLAKQQKAA